MKSGCKDTPTLSLKACNSPPVRLNQSSLLDEAFNKLKISGVLTHFYGWLLPSGVQLEVLQPDLFTGRAELLVHLQEPIRKLQSVC